MDFYNIKHRNPKKDTYEIYPEFVVGASKDIIIKGKGFSAVWDEEAGLWSTDEFDVARLIDKELDAYEEKNKDMLYGKITKKYMRDFSSNSWKEYKKYLQLVENTTKAELDSKVAFSNTDVKKTDYITKRLPYALEKGKCSAYNKLMSTLYSPEERAKLEWAIGAIIAGDSKKIQKFIVLYGDPGTGKSTFLEIVQKLFEGYYIVFEAKSLTSTSNAFSTEVFKNNPLIAIQHDGDLSRIEDNTKINSIISHEEIVINEKYRNAYSMRSNCFLFMGTNKPVKITDAKAGLIRRLIDVRPTGNKLDPDEYYDLIDKIDYELGFIANHCLEVYKSMGKDYYSKYRPVDMMYKTDPFFNFVEDTYTEFIKPEFKDGISLKTAYGMYKTYCDETNAEYKLQMYKFREELKNYFEKFYDVIRIGDQQIRSFYVGFMTSKFNRSHGEATLKKENKLNTWIIFTDQKSVFDEECKDCPAQLSNDSGTPSKKWINVTTTLSNIDTHEVHYVKVPENHIVIDFDLKDEKGEKSFKLNMEAASAWPETYAELSKSGGGIHLHYIYNGDPLQLSRIYGDNIEIKVFTGNSSLRRKLSKCNNLPIATISSGLPLKERRGRMVNNNVIKTEKGLRAMIKKNLNKEVHAATKPSVDFIFKLLEDFYKTGESFDVSDMRPAVMAFAANSSNQSEYCLKLVSKMHFKSDDVKEVVEEIHPIDSNLPIAFYDIEVFPNLFLVNWKLEGEDKKVVRMINPSPAEIEALVYNHRLIGFNCRRYDNHLMYARMMGYNNEELYRLSGRIINSQKGSSENCFFREAYNLSYTDVYDFASAGHKQSLKKFEIELGIKHHELGMPWDQPVPEEKWLEVAEYCDDDVIATEKVFEYLSADWMARLILADVAGLTPNDTTNTLTTRIIFGSNRNPQDQFEYRKLSDDHPTKPSFPGYTFDNGKSLYRGEEVGEGGYVYAEPGMYGNVALLDIASMHPSSIMAENLFGDEYTKRFGEIMQARLAAKHHDFEKAKTLLNGSLNKYLDSEDKADALAGALKTAINSVYGLTDASFPNPFKDPRNIDNIVAKRGALFMVDLKHAVQEQGYTVAHIKTDSIKIPDATPEIIQFVMDFGKKYGYTFEHEATYERMCLVNNAVYIAKYKDGKHAGEWTATGAQFQQPYVFKTLFSKDPVEFKDLCEAKEVKTAIYLDLNENGNHDYQFIGKVGEFCPILPGNNAGLLVRESTAKDGTIKYDAVTGTKDHRWMESEIVKSLNLEDRIDMSYYNEMVDKAIETISKYGDFEWFVSDDPYISAPFNGGKIK